MSKGTPCSTQLIFAEGLIEKQSAEIERLTAELAECRSDAERYRFIRNEWFKEDGSWLMGHECAFLDTPEEMDTAIDKEIKNVE